VILECTQGIAVELRITNDYALVVDESDAVLERPASRICEIVSRKRRSPFGRDELRLTDKLCNRLLRDPCVQALIDDEDDGDDKHNNNCENVE
jgi:hypothetical protein